MEIRMNGNGLHAGENAARTLTLSVDAAYRDHEIRLALLSPAGRRFLTPEITLTNGEAQYPLPACVLDAGGRLLAQIVAENDDLQVIKSDVFGFDVERSIPTEGAQPGCDGLITLGSLHNAVTAVEETLALCARTSDLPTVPENVSAFENDADYATKAFVEETVDIAQRESLPAHTHDGRYYTETETDALLAEKADLTDLPATAVGSFTLDQSLTGATVSFSRVRQIGDAVYVSLLVELGEAIGSSSKLLGTISGVANPAATATVVPCLTKGSGANDTHLAFATIGIGAVAVKSTDSSDEYVYIETCYQAGQ